MFYSAILILLFQACMEHLCCNITPITYSPIITLPQGQLKGFEETSTDGKIIYSFKRIPYAKPPIGSLRFELPVEHVRWSGVFEATKDPNKCVQNDIYAWPFPPPIITGDEDCLYLNVFTPKPLGQNHLPVMVYIHGGAWIQGGADEATPYVLLNENIVLVCIQYRLGVFGFLSTEDSSMPGNLGLKDQQLALQWVQKNIRRFGGDPDKVTIFGESAGAASVHLHMLSPGSAGLFIRAISQSGTALCPFAVGKTHRTFAAQLGAAASCTLGGNSDAFKTCLKAVPKYKLHKYSLVNFQWGFTPFVYSPRVDKDFLPDEPIKLLKSGKYNKVNFINGVNRDEGALFIALLFLYPLWTKQLLDNFAVIAPLSLLAQNEPNAANLATTIYDHYLNGKELASIPVPELVKMLTDIYFNVGSDYADFLHAQDKDMKLYLYEFDYKGQNSILNLFGIILPQGFFQYISHVDDLFYLFSGGSYFRKFKALPQQDVDVRKKVSKMWTNFAKFGDPTPDLSLNFKWSPASLFSFGHLNITQTPTMMGYSRSQNLRFWLSLKTNLNHQLLSGLPWPL